MVLIVSIANTINAKDLPRLPSEKKRVAYHIAQTGDTLGYSKEQVKALLRYLPPSKRNVLDTLYFHNVRQFRVVSEAEEASLKARAKKEISGFVSEVKHFKKPESVQDVFSSLAQLMQNKVMKIAVASIGFLFVLLLIKRILFRG